MQPAGVNALLAIAGNAVPANAAAGATVTDEGGGTGQQFSQLLGDSGTQYDSQGGMQQFARGTALPVSATAALSAQEIGAETADGLAQLLEAREKAVTAEDAADLITRIDKMMDQPRSALEVQALSHIKEQLQLIRQEGVPKTIGEIIQSVPAVRDAKMSMVALTAVLTLKKAETAQAAIAVDETTPSPLLQSLQAAMFRSDGGKTATASAAASVESEEKGLENAQSADSLAASTVTLIQPMAAIVVSPISEPVRDLSASGRSSAELEAAIPSLKLPEDTSLPEIELPKLNDGVLARKATMDGTFQAMAAANGAVNDNVKADVAALTQEKAGGANIHAILNPLHMHGMSPTQMVSAAQPVSIIPTHGYANHAPMTEQVHVAIHQAAKDGIDRMTIQLDPVELGRVEISMTMNREGQTQITFLVDKAETFDSLSRDARMLERSLQEAGIKADTGSMQFNLRQQNQGQMQSDLNGQDGQQGGAQGQQTSAMPESPVTSTVAMDPITRNYLFNVREGVDISA